MEQPIYVNQADFHGQVARLVDESGRFLDSMKPIKPLQSGTPGLMSQIKKQVNEAEIRSVSDISMSLDVLDTELQKILNKFFIINNSYKRDQSLASFLGDFKDNPADAFTKLVNYSDGCIQQIDAVITAYSDVERGITKANLWIKHIMANFATQKIADKARKAKAIVLDLSKIIAHVRNVSHNSKLELLNLRNIATKCMKTRTLQSSA